MWIMYLVNTSFRKLISLKPINLPHQQGYHQEIQSNTIQIHAVKGFNLQLIIKRPQQEQRRYVEMEHIVLAEVVEAHVLIMVESQDGYNMVCRS